MHMDSERIILFDGECHVCSWSVGFVIKRDPQKRFRFASLQSEKGRECLRSAGLDPDRFDSVVVLEAGRAFLYSDAVFVVLRQLKGIWSLLSVFRLLPRFLRDGVYRWFAGRRYRWFGKRAACMVPTSDIMERFL